MPAALSAFLNNAYRIIDQHAVQWLGVDAQAAIASSSFVFIGFFAGYSIISGGAISLVARAVGANDKKEQQKLIGNALTAATVLGIVILSLSAMLADKTAGLLGLQADLAVQAATYLRWHAQFCLPQALMPTLDAIFIAYGRTHTVLLLQMTAAVLNIALNPICIYRLGYGIGGAAMATGLSQTVAVLLGLFLLKRLSQPKISDFCLSASVFRIAKIGLPMCWGALMFAAVYWALLRWVISPLGSSVNAALGIGFSVLEGCTWPIFWGFSMGIASIVGRSLGAGRIDDAHRAIHLAFRLMTVAGLIAAGVFRLGAEFLCALFTNDAEVLREAILYAHILAFSQLFVAYESLADGILSGAGKTASILRWSAPLNMIRIPLCWTLAVYFGFGAAGIWWAINLSTLLKALGKWSTVLKGDWQR